MTQNGSYDVRQDSGGLLGRTGIMLGAGVGALLLGRYLFWRAKEADLTGQVALITGGSSGLGLLLARELAQEGCRIVICARNEEHLASAKAELTRLGAEVMTQVCDVSDPDQIDQLIRDATGRFGRVDILVNNAGLIQYGPMETQHLEDYKKAMDVMYWGMVNPTLAVLPQMRERGDGRIVNITSIGGKISVPRLLSYSSAKFAAVGFSEGLHAELMKYGIKVTTIVPGLMRTGSFINAEFTGQREKEFTWFGLMSSLPVISMDAERAAQQIVNSVKRGETERILSIPANLAAMYHGLFPGRTADLAGLIDRFVMPRPDESRDEAASGLEMQRRTGSPIFDRVTYLGQKAAERFQTNDGSSVDLREETNGEVHP